QRCENERGQGNAAHECPRVSRQSRRKDKRKVTQLTCATRFGTLAHSSPNSLPVTDLTPPPSVLEAARRLAPLVRDHAAETETNRELPKPVFHALADAGLYLMCVPRAVGGLEIDFPTYIQVLEELGKADASTAWTVSQGANWATYSARIARDAARGGIEYAGGYREGRGGAGRLPRHRPAALQHRLHARFLDGGARPGNRE